MLNQQQVKDLNEIRRLLHEAYEHYFTYSDGYSKLSEGYVSVSFGNYFQRPILTSTIPVPVEVTVYSYVFGPHRHNYYESTAEALAAVTEWHATEMATEYDRNGDPV